MRIGRWLRLYHNWKLTEIVSELEGDWYCIRIGRWLRLYQNWKMTEIVSELKGDWDCIRIGRWLILYQNWKVTDIVSEFEGDWDCIRIGRWLRLYRSWGTRYNSVEQWFSPGYQNINPSMTDDAMRSRVSSAFMLPISGRNRTSTMTYIVYVINYPYSCKETSSVYDIISLKPLNYMKQMIGWRV